MIALLIIDMQNAYFEAATPHQDARQRLHRDKPSLEAAELGRGGIGSGRRGHAQLHRPDGG
jgi:hypothetical protein